MAEVPPLNPEIPSNAKTAESHAPPPNLNGAAPASEPEPIAPQPDPVTPKTAPAEAAGPQPMEAMFWQMRDDQKRLERVLLVTMGGLLLLALYMGIKSRAKGGGPSIVYESAEGLE